ncbi:hypothetical protein [Cognatiluteimonas weifangensis]|uniref:hypothetical protein n=1 Tax=Cognatiluteimonas weifangensis TaxID=2303539 RepID=UPI0011C18756|nr:hypothetical protein [Luteimonas weifangensis]
MCYFSVTLLPGGEVLRADLGECQFAPDFGERMRTALVGQTMPYVGFESVFQRTYRFEICAPKHLCVQ